MRIYKSSTSGVCSYFLPQHEPGYGAKLAGWKFTVFLCRVSLYLVQPESWLPAQTSWMEKGRTAAALTKLGFGLQGTDLSPPPEMQQPSGP